MTKRGGKNGQPYSGAAKIFLANIMVDNKAEPLGAYDMCAETAFAYDERAREVGRYGMCNFDCEAAFEAAFEAADQAGESTMRAMEEVKMLQERLADMRGKGNERRELGVPQWGRAVVQLVCLTNPIIVMFCATAKQEESRPFALRIFTYVP